LNIDFINGLAGSGKTHQAIITGAWHWVQRGDRYIVAVPTIGLIKQMMADLPNDARISMIVSDDELGPDGKRLSVGQKIKDVMEAPATQGQLVFITHAGLKLMPYINNREWNVIVDEALPITDLYEIPSSDEQLIRLVKECKIIAEHNGFRTLRTTKRPPDIFGDEYPADPVRQTDVHKLAWRLYDRNSFVYVTDDFSTNEDGSINENSHFFCLTTEKILAPFKEVTMMAANFTDSLVYKLWKVKFSENRAITKKLKFQEHDGRNAKINHLFDNGWSKTFYEKEHDGKTVMDAVLDKINLEYQDKNYLWVANRGIGDSALSGIRLPNISHGLNCYQDHDSIVFLSALNPSNMEIKFFKFLGISREDIMIARYYEAIYQAVMRTGLRRNDETPVRIIVPDKDAAEYLQTKLIGSSIEKLDWFNIEHKAVGRPATGKAMTPAERKRESRRRKKEAEKAGSPATTECHDNTLKDTIDISVTSNSVRGFQPVLAENAITYYRQHCMERGNRHGNKLIFTLALNLQKSNMEPSDIKSTLEYEASMSALKKEDWKKNIKTTLRKLKI
jgi:hypothetical protein